MAAPESPEPASSPASEALQHEAHILSRIVRRYGWRLLFVFVALLLPLWGFAELADEIREGEVIVFDAPILQLAHAVASPTLDQVFMVITDIGYLYGVVPFDVVLVLVLFWRRHLRAGTFATIALAGSGLLNVATKAVFARDRPALWDSIAPELTYSFPSGHAMGSATLACVLVVLSWHTRWRWPMVVVMSLFVLLVGFSRVYLGVHYPSDILAGWAAASVWAAASFLAVFRLDYQPWRSRGKT